MVVDPLQEDEDEAAEDIPLQATAMEAMETALGAAMANIHSKLKNQLPKRRKQHQFKVSRETKNNTTLTKLAKTPTGAGGTLKKSNQVNKQRQSHS